MVTRRRFLQGGLLATTLPFNYNVRASSEDDQVNMHQRIARVIREYSEQGIHRTGTEVDNLSADWLLTEIDRLGVSPIDSSFAFDRLNPLSNELRIDGVTIPGVPLYDCSYTDSQGFEGTLGELGSDADIAVAMSLPHNSGPNAKKIHAARESGIHKAIVIVTDKRFPADGIALLNAEDFSKPFGPPVLQVAGKHWPVLRDAINNPAESTLTLHSEYVKSTARNVEAKIDGEQPELAPIVVMTPRSGWWYNASERGGGIACFLEIMRALQGSNPARDVIFTANTGHELAHLGLDHFLEQNPDLIEDAHIWIHLGANFASKIQPNVRLQFSDEDAMSTLSPHLGANHLEPGAVTPIGERPDGEARNVFDGGGRYLSILGGNGLFHHPSDQWPDAVDLDVTARWTQAFVAAALDLARV